MSKLTKTSLLVAILLLAFLAIPAFADQVASGSCGANGDNLTWTLDSNYVLTISGNGAMANYDNENMAPWKSRYIKAMVIDSGVTSIGDYAFEGCDLSSLELPGSLTHIAANAFHNCYSLTNLTVDPANTCFTVEDGVLYNKEKTELLFCLSSRRGILIIPDSVTAIGDNAFEGSGAELTYVLVPLSVTSIGNSVIDDMPFIWYAGNETQWNQITFGENDFTYIRIQYNHSLNDDMDSGTCGVNGDNLTWTMGSDGVLTISGSGAMADYAFDEGPDINAPYVNYFMSISSVVIESGVTRVGAYAFNAFHTLESVTIADTVTSIGRAAFGNCVNLTSISIPDSVTEIGDGCFYDNGRLPAIHVDAGNPNYCSEDGVLFNKAKTVLISCPGGKSGSYTVPQSVTSIAEYAFSSSNLSEIVFQEGLTSIGDRAFIESKLSRLEFPTSLTHIGAIAFSGCDNLTDIYYAGSEEQWNQITIGEYNEDLENITIHYNYSPATVVASGTCGAEGDNLTWTLNSDGVLSISGVGAMADYDYSTNRAPWYEHRDSVLVAAIDNGVTNIGDYAFNECRQMMIVFIPDTVTSFGESAFSVCDCLTSISIPNSVTEIGEGCFFSCMSLTELTIPASVTSIGSDAFNWSWNLEAIHVDAANPAYSSEDGVLFNKAKTNLIRYPEGKGGSYTVPQSVTTIAESAFCECVGLSEIVFPDRLTSIGDSAFYECNLSSLELPNSLTHIGEFAFGLCYGLTEVTIPAGVTTIGNNPFFYCENLTNLIVDQANSYFAAEDGVLYNKAKTELLSCLSSKKGTLIIPDGVTVIGENAFFECSGLTSIEIPLSVIRIDNNAFRGRTGLTKVYYPGTEAQWNQITIGESNAPLISASILYNSDIIASGTCGAQGNNLIWTLLSDGALTVSGDGAMADYSFENSAPWFEYRDSIIAVVIESGVTNIGSMSFSSCNHLESVGMPDSVTHIGIYAFAWCQSLTEMALPDHLNYIGESAFDSCRGLQSVTLPGSLTVLGRGAFAYAGLTEVKVQSGTETVDHYFYEPDNQGQPRLYRVALPKNTTVGEMPFLESALPTNMHPDFTTPSALTTIDQEAFFGTAASFIWLADGVTSIGDGAFAGCEGLRFIRIPRQCTSIGTDAIPAGVTILCERDSAAEQYASDHNCTPLHFTIGGNG